MSDDLASLVVTARQKLVDIDAGTQHAIWEVIFDAEAHITAGVAVMDREQCVRSLRKFTAPHHEQ